MTVFIRDLPGRFSQQVAARSANSSWAGLHDTVFPDRPSVRQGCTCWVPTSWRPWHLKLKTVTIPKRWAARQKLAPNLGRQCIIWAELHETGGLSATLAVHRLGRCRATRPWRPSLAPRSSWCVHTLGRLLNVGRTLLLLF